MDRLIHIVRKGWSCAAAIFCCAFLLSFYVSNASAASLSISPSSGSFEVGSTFDVSVLLDTQGEDVNTVSVSLHYPPDKLQLVSPATTLSIITLWTNQPTFNNQIGQVNLQGGIPGGINVSSGLITKLTFRVRSTGVAVVKFLDSSRVLLHDGHGTDALSQTQSGIFNLVLPPPAGPEVASETHPDQGHWYANQNVKLHWGTDEDVQGYSYVLSDRPVDLPDDISEGDRNTIAYSGAANGTHYFHIKALREGTWGGVTHFAVNIDFEPPAEFPIEIVPGEKTSRRRPVIQFATTDNLSTIDHYELKVVPLFKTANPEEKFLFVEAVSPYVPATDFELGSYDVIVRAYDKAGNFREVSKRLKIVTAVLSVVSDSGLQVTGNFIVPWAAVWVLLILLVFLAIYVAWHARHAHHTVHEQRVNRTLPIEVSKQLDELRRYRQKYGSMMMFLIGLLCLQFLFGPGVLAQQRELTPPYIESVSKNISNEEIFYVGGKTDAENTEVVIYLQNLQSGETFSYSVFSDKNGEWFYRHNGFLNSGNYLLWTQSRVNDELSPPTAQYTMAVRSTAIQFGSSRISYEVLYIFIILVLAVILAILVFYIIHHALQARRKRTDFIREVKEAEESIRRGFAVLRRDIQSELAIIHQMKVNKTLSEEEKFREAQLLTDLDMVERTIGKEIWDVEQSEI